jgi:long-chain-fatty-acid--CoA ligase ACSBG
MCANTGAILAGVIPAGVYTTNSPDACGFIAHHCQAEIIVVENNIQLEKYIQCLKAQPLPYLKAVVMYAESPSPSHLPLPVSSIPVYTFQEFLDLGKGVPSSLVEDRINGTTPGHCASLIYTSGTTGPPKAAMLSHDNITWAAKTVQDYFTDAGCTERYVSYLPLSHISAQLIDVHSPMYLGACTYIAQPDALKGSLVETLKEVRPTVFFGVPRGPSNNIYICLSMCHFIRSLFICCSVGEDGRAHAESGEGRHGGEEDHIHLGQSHRA